MPDRDGRARAGETNMARLEMPELALAGLGQAPSTVDVMFELGMMCAIAL